MQGILRYNDFGDYKKGVSDLLNSKSQTNGSGTS